MEDFKKNLLKMGKTNRTVPAVLLIAAVFFLLFGIFMIPHKVQPFDPTSGGYASLNIVYVMGPFAEQTSDGRTVKKILCCRKRQRLLVYHQHRKLLSLSCLQ